MFKTSTGGAVFQLNRPCCSFKFFVISDFIVDFIQTVIEGFVETKSLLLLLHLTENIDIILQVSP